MINNFDKIVIESIKPLIDGGRYPVKREVGDVLEITADIFKDGHDVLAALIKFRKKGTKKWEETPMIHICNDEWRGSFMLPENARYEYTIEAYTERFLSWREELHKKIKNTDLTSEILEGIDIIEVSAKLAKGVDKDIIKDTVKKMKKYLKEGSQLDAAKLALSSDFKILMLKYPDRSLSTEYSQTLQVTVDRVKARYAAWYEMFPRSQGTKEGKSATFKDCEKRLPEIKKMGFDVIYFPPIHPIGKTNRKGPNNSLKASPTDPGCPYAIGSEEGGHMAIEPQLGTFKDFESFRKKADEYGMEIALDFAINCSPDHPYVKEHPDWFYKRPDGTIKYAENPPKKYEDIYPLNFYCEDREGLWNEMLNFFLFWADKGGKNIPCG